ncbi:protein transport protein bet1 [Tieghemiomyces parasiticus]|uniref:Protein transport protein bet1 n=1 Tax=Tieghemiomyces parasiticus TaxID=78921 RepID=A0A9W8DM41_9FUNG|nr:protein transport protein bet1 [Tieghemiomyces parasiticus]
MHSSSRQSHRARRADWPSEASSSATSYAQPRYYDESNAQPAATLDENDKTVDSLRSKLLKLKDVTLDIGHEIRDQNTFLGQMSQDFDSTGSALAGTMKRFYRMAASQSGAYMWLLCLFAVLICTFLYFFLKWGG